MKTNKKKANIISIAVSVVAFGLFMWLFSLLLLPTFAFLSPSLLLTMLLAGLCTTVVAGIVSSITEWALCNSYRDYEEKPANIISLLFMGLIVILLLLGCLISWTWFHVGAARERINPVSIEAEEFVEMLPDYNSETAYSWADSDTARKLAARKTGELGGENASLFTSLDSAYTVIKDDAIVKYVPLDYNGFFSYRKGKTIPGYVMVDPVTLEAEYVEKAYSYSPGAYFGKDRDRVFWRHNPSAYYGNVFFEVDPEGTPCWVAEVEEADTWFVHHVTGIAVMNAVTGEVTDYSLENAPAWTTNIHGNTATEYYNSWGKYINGYWNLSNEGETQVTDDFGYVAINGTMYYYTGVTSKTMSGGDESNMGVLLYNSRTGEALYCQMPGAEEYSAMSAVQGVVQNYNYEASFPSLCNVNGELTYVMVLKDANGIVRQYGMANYSNHTVATSGDTLKETAVKYMQMLNKTTPTIGELVEMTITVQDVKFITIEGNTVTYIQSADGEWFKKTFTENDLFVQIGDEMTILTSTEGLVHVIAIQ